MTKDSYRINLVVLGNAATKQQIQAIVNTFYAELLKLDAQLYVAYEDVRVNPSIKGE